MRPAAVQDSNAVTGADTEAGLKPEEVHVNVENRVLTIAGERKAAELPDLAAQLEHQHSEGWARLSALEDAVQARLTPSTMTP